MNSKLPFSSDVRTAAMPVSRLVSVTVAPGTTAPELSLIGADDGGGVELGKCA